MNFDLLSAFNFKKISGVKRKFILFTTGGKIVTRQGQAVKISHSVGTAENTDDFTLLHYGQTPDIVLDHQLDSEMQR